MSAEKLPARNTIDNSLYLSIRWYGNLWLGDSWSRDSKSEFTLKYCLFGGAKLAKSFDSVKYIYTGHNVGLDLCSEFSLTDGSVGKNIITLKVDMGYELICVYS